YGLREPLERRRRLRRLPAPEDRQAVRASLDRDGAPLRLPAPRGRRVRRLSLRVRLTLAFATAMALVLAAMGFFVYIRVGDALGSSVDQSLKAQAAETASHLGRQSELTDSDFHLVDPDTAAGPVVAEVLDARGHVVRSSPAGLPAPVGP